MCDCCDYVAARGGHAGDDELIAEWERVWRASTRATVRERGWVALSVDSQPPVSYTIGLWGQGHPELVLFGLSPSTAQNVLDALAERIRHRDIALRDGDRLGGAGWSGWEFAVFRLPNPGKVVLRANAYYRRRPRESVPALQLVYPDAHGTWPWEPGCHQPPGTQPLPGHFAA